MTSVRCRRACTAPRCLKMIRIDTNLATRTNGPSNSTSYFCRKPFVATRRLVSLNKALDDLLRFMHSLVADILSGAFPIHFSTCHGSRRLHHRSLDLRQKRNCLASVYSCLPLVNVSFMNYTSQTCDNPAARQRVKLIRPLMVRVS